MPQRIVTRPTSPRPPKGRQQDMSAEHLPEHHPTVPEVFSPFEDSTALRIHVLSTVPSNTQPFLRSLLSKTLSFRGRFFPPQARQCQQPTSLIFAFSSVSGTPLTHEVCYASMTSHVLNVATAHAPARTATEDSKNHSQQSRA